MRDAHPWPLIAVVTIFTIGLAIIIVLLLGPPQKAEPNYTSWCDAPTGNRLFLFANGSGTVVPADSAGAKC